MNGDQAETVADDMTEKTMVLTMEVPGERDWRWMPELNILVLSPHLDDLGRRRAIREGQRKWAECWTVECGA